MRLTALFSTTALLVSAAQAQPNTPHSFPAAALPAPVWAALERTQLPADALAAVALPVGSSGGWLGGWFGPRAWGHQPQRSMQPGSAMKVLTSIVALDRLGPNLRGSTELRSAAPLAFVGKPSEGTLQGDLVLKGGADPELGLAQFWALLQELRAAGVHTITGNLVVDRTLWRPARMDVGLPPFDDAPQWPYNVIPDALQLAGALLPLQLSSDAYTLRAGSVPPLPQLVFDTRQLTLNDARCADWAGGWKDATTEATSAVDTVTSDTVAIDTETSDTRTAPTPGGTPAATVVTLHGSYPKNCTQRVDLQLLDRQLLTEKLFAALWQQLGGRWLGQAVEGPTPPGTRLLARRVSRPWGEVLRGMNKTSDNALTRMLFLNLGTPSTAANPEATTAELAARAVHGWFAEHGISSAGVVLENGSGLSRSERISPLQLAQMLQVAYSARYAPDLMMSLPVPGVDGTMRNRLKDSPAAGWARLKTGTLRNVVALAGYVTDASGQPWAVAMMINHDNASRGRPVLDALIDHIARHGPHPAPAPAPWQEGGGP